MNDLKSQYIATMICDIPDDLAELKSEIAEFYTYPEAESWEVNWSPDNNSFLAEVGLPASAPTMINFNSNAINEADLVCIGFNNHGDRIVILKATGEVVFINHDYDDRIEYMNQDVISLFRCICAYAEMMKGDEDLAARVTSIDSKAYDEGSWWKQNAEQ